MYNGFRFVHLLIVIICISRTTIAPVIHISILSILQSVYVSSSSSSLSAYKDYVFVSLQSNVYHVPYSLSIRKKLISTSLSPASNFAEVRLSRCLLPVTVFSRDFRLHNVRDKYVVFMNSPVEVHFP